MWVSKRMEMAVSETFPDPDHKTQEGLPPMTNPVLYDDRAG
jgi:hypothetical protein